MTCFEIAQYLNSKFADCADFYIRTTTLGNAPVYIAVLSGVSDKNYISENILRPISAFTAQSNTCHMTDISHILTAAKTTAIDDVNLVVSEILSGNAMIFYDCCGNTQMYSVACKNEDGRAINEPDSEVVVRGPRQGFVENAETNTAMLRKIIASNELKVENMKIGGITKTTVRMVYLNGIADKNALALLKKRISQINLDSVIDSGYIEQFLQKKGYSFFPEVGNSEKPDKVAAKIIEGRIAVICEGSPCVLTVPYLFTESLQSAEDYLKTAYYATLMRIVRFLGLMFTLFMPAIYLAALEYHNGVIPRKLFESTQGSREDIPFSVFTELLVILLIFELIREVGIRMPKAVGDAVSIVGGLVLGDAAIKAGIASEPVIMVAALTAISNFINPPFMNSTVLIRLVNLVAAKIFGVFGIALCFTCLVFALCAKDSFGVPYMYPFSPASVKGLIDSLVLLPKKALLQSTSELDNTGE